MPPRQAPPAFVAHSPALGRPLVRALALARPSPPRRRRRHPAVAAPVRLSAAGPDPLPPHSKPRVQDAPASARPVTSASANGAPRPDDPATHSPSASASEQSQQQQQRHQHDAFDPLGVRVAQQPAPGTIPISLGSFSTAVPARWLLYSVPFFWGSFAPAVRFLFAQDRHLEPSVFNSARLILSTLIYVPVLAAEFSIFRASRNSTASAAPAAATTPADPPSFAFFPAGIELGIYVFLANVSQVLGLQHTSASRAAFLVQLQTVFVPVISGLLGLDKISRQTWLSSGVAVAGVALLSSDKGHGTVSSLSGDALEILSALFFSTYIIRLSKYCNDIPANPLVATKIAVQAVLSIVWAVSAELFVLLHHTPTDLSAVAEDPAPWTAGAVLAGVAVIFWTGVMSSAASGWAQTKGQQGVPPSEAVVIFATQPLWASALAALVLGESFGPKGFAGGALIIAATLLASKTDGSGDSESEEEKKDKEA